MGDGPIGMTIHYIFQVPLEDVREIFESIRSLEPGRIDPSQIGPERYSDHDIESILSFISLDSDTAVQSRLRVEDEEGELIGHDDGSISEIEDRYDRDIRIGYDYFLEDGGSR